MSPDLWIQAIQIFGKYTANLDITSGYKQIYFWVNPAVVSESDIKRLQFWGFFDARSLGLEAFGRTD